MKTVESVFSILLMAARIGSASSNLYQIHPGADARMELTVEKTGLLSGKKHLFTFPQYQGTLMFDDEAPERSTIALSIESASISCHDTWLSMKDLRKVQEYALKDMLAADRHPQITFRSIAIKRIAAGQFEVQGTLTIRDISKPAVAAVSLHSGSNGILSIEGVSRLRLTDFGLKPPTAALGTIGTGNEMSFHFVLRATPGGGTTSGGNKREPVQHYRSETLMQTVTSRPQVPPEPVSWHTSALKALQNHWPEYFMEAAALGAFMISACVFSVLLEHPSSPLHQAFEDVTLVRRALIGLAMGLTAVGIISSPWGQRSGAHMNPSVTLTFLVLGKVAPWDAFFYVLFQFVGGVGGVLAASLLIGPPLQHSAVDYAVTAPGPGGPGVAFLAEFAISMLLMSTILVISNSASLSRFTPLFAGALVATFIIVEAPLSGMSMNPARTFGSALSANEWTALWVYFTAPLAGMLLAAAVYQVRRGAHAVFCAKLHHSNSQRCIFNCRYGDLNAL